MLENLLCQKLAHAGRVGCRRRSVKAALVVAAYHALAMVVATIVGKGPHIPTACVELWPAHIAKLLDAIDVRQQPRWLLSIGVRILALMPRDGRELGVPEHLSNFRQLPNGCRLASVCHTEIFGMLEEARDLKALPLRRLGGLDAPNREMDKLVARLSSLPLRGKLSR